MSGTLRRGNYRTGAICGEKGRYSNSHCQNTPTNTSTRQHYRELDASKEKFREEGIAEKTKERWRGKRMHGQLTHNLNEKLRLRSPRGRVLAFGTQVRWFKPGQGEKFLSTPSFGREVKPFVSCRTFTACKRSLNVT